MAEMFVQTNTFDAPVERVYRTIADSQAHAALTGAPAEIGTAAGDAFTTHGGAIEGWILDLQKNERIVQAWRPADWPAGSYSVVRYDFRSDGDGTELTLTHSAVPDGGSSHLQAGWQDNYWEPLTAHLAS